MPESKPDDFAHHNWTRSQSGKWHKVEFYSFGRIWDDDNDTFVADVRPTGLADEMIADHNARLKPDAKPETGSCWNCGAAGSSTCRFESHDWGDPCPDWEPNPNRAKPDAKPAREWQLVVYTNRPNDGPDIYEGSERVGWCTRLEDGRLIVADHNARLKPAAEHTCETCIARGANHQGLPCLNCIHRNLTDRWQPKESTT